MTASQEYEIQHFGFSSEQFSLERRHVIKDAVNDSLDELFQKIKTSESTTDVLAQRKSKVVEKMLATFENKLVEIEKFDVDNFSIPEYVLLKEECAQAMKYTMEDEKILDDEIEKLKQLFLENSIMIAALEIENEQYELVKDAVSEELAVHSQIEESFKSVDMRKALEMVESTCKLINKNADS